MTIPGYGRLTPLQVLVLELAGEVPDRFRQELSDQQRMDAMVSARAELAERTGQDFGYDLAAWHAWLAGHEPFSNEYTHPYGWKQTKRKLDSLFGDERRLRLVQNLELKDSAH